MLPTGLTTVRELIEKLETFPADEQITVSEFKMPVHRVVAQLRGRDPDDLVDVSMRSDTEKWWDSAIMRGWFFVGGYAVAELARLWLTGRL